MEERFRQDLTQRGQQGTFRNLRHGGSGGAESGGGISAHAPSSSCPPPAPPAAIDFASNDYLGLARCPRQLRSVERSFASLVRSASAASAPLLGSTGSRLLSGDTALAAGLEAFLAAAHHRPAALLFNSGYDANLSVLGSVLRPEDVVILDELCHNSLVMGMRMSRLGWESRAGDRAARTFRHNDPQDLERVLRQARDDHGPGSGGEILVVVESVYSMDGDVAPLGDILDLAESYGASVVVDEAHGLGIYGMTNVDDLSLGERVRESSGTFSTGSATGEYGGTGVLAAAGLEHHRSLLCSVHTFGKAAGCHGAVVVASQTMVNYLINYARPFVYSTAPPPHALVTIRCAYESMMGREGEDRRLKLFGLVRLFRRSMEDRLMQPSAALIATKCRSPVLLPSPSPIQAVLVPGNRRCVELCSRLNSRSFDVYPIRSPTVTKGQERVRIILHSHNTEEEVLGLVKALVFELISLDRKGGRDLSRSKL